MASQRVIRPATEDDVEALVDLHRRVFLDDPARIMSQPGRLAGYYRHLLFDNPWVDQDLLSWAMDGPAGDLVGFLGVMPRPLRFEGRRVRSAVTTAFMVDPALRDPRVATQLMLRVFRGPQELTWTDGATDTTKRVWTGLGGHANAGLSVKWARLYAPCRVTLQGSEPGGGRRWRRLAMKALCPLADAVARRLPPFRPTGSELTSRDLEVAELVALHGDVAPTHPVFAEYDEPSVKWLIDFMSAYDLRGRVALRASERQDGTVVGWNVRYTRHGGIDDVMQLAARPGAMGLVLRDVLADAHAHGAAAVQGRLEAAVIPHVWDAQCVGKRGGWMVYATEDPALERAMAAGTVFLSPLDGETWIPLGSSVQPRERPRPGLLPIPNGR